MLLAIKIRFCIEVHGNLAKKAGKSGNIYISCDEEDLIYNQASLQKGFQVEDNKDRGVGQLYGVGHGMHYAVE